MPSPNGKNNYRHQSEAHTKRFDKTSKANSAWWCLMYMKTHQLQTGFEAQGSNIDTTVRIPNIL